MLHKKKTKTVMELCLDIEGQTAIVNGESIGLGMTFAETLAECGVNLVIAARRYGRLAKVAEESTQKYNIGVVSVKTDVAQEKQVTNMVETAVDNFGSL